MKGVMRRKYVKLPGGDVMMKGVKSGEVCSR